MARGSVRVELLIRNIFHGDHSFIAFAKFSMGDGFIKRWAKIKSDSEAVRRASASVLGV